MHAADEPVEVKVGSPVPITSKTFETLFGELYRASGDWKFRAVGQGYTSGLPGIARDYGVNV